MTAVYSGDANDKASPLYGGHPESFVPLATTYFSNVTINVTYILAVIFFLVLVPIIIQFMYFFLNNWTW